MSASSTAGLVHLLTSPPDHRIFILLVGSCQALTCPDCRVPLKVGASQTRGHHLAMLHLAAEAPAGAAAMSDALFGAFSLAMTTCVLDAIMPAELEHLAVFTSAELAGDSRVRGLLGASLSRPVLVSCGGLEEVLGLGRARHSSLPVQVALQGACDEAGAAGAPLGRNTASVRATVLAAAAASAENASAANNFDVAFNRAHAWLAKLSAAATPLPKTVGALCHQLEPLCRVRQAPLWTAAELLIEIAREGLVGLCGCCGAVAFRADRALSKLIGADALARPTGVRAAAAAADSLLHVAAAVARRIDDWAAAHAGKRLSVPVLLRAFEALSCGWVQVDVHAVVSVLVARGLLATTDSLAADASDGDAPLPDETGIAAGPALGEAPAPLAVVFGHEAHARLVRKSTAVRARRALRARVVCVRPVLAFSEVPHFAKLMAGACAKLGWLAANANQAEFVPLVAAGASAALVGVAGSGRTTALLLGALLRHASAGASSTTLFLCASRDAAMQLTRRTTALAPGWRCCALVGGLAVRSSMKGAAECKLLFGTPGRVVDMLQRGALVAERVRHLVLDDADVLFAANRAVLSELWDALQARLTAGRVQVTLACLHLSEELAAVLPPHVETLVAVPRADGVSLLGNDGDLTSAAAASAHVNVLLPGLVHRLAIVRTGDEVRALRALIVPGATLVFVDSSRRVDELVESLSRLGLRHVFAYHDALESEARAHVVGLVCDEERLLKQPPGASDELLSDWVVVSTNLMAFGLDSVRVEHVIMFKLGADEADLMLYARRAARAGRNGVAGFVTTVCSADEAAQLTALAEQDADVCVRFELVEHLEIADADTGAGARRWA